MDQTPTAPPAPIEMPAADASPAMRIAFLEHQLAGVFSFLAQKDATEAACIKRYEGLYATRYAAMREQHERKMKQLKGLGERLITNAHRYEFLRQHQVQIWKLGIAAQGDKLDSLLDAAKERVERPVMNETKAT